MSSFARLMIVCLLASPLSAADAVVSASPRELRTQAGAVWSTRKTSAQPWMLMARSYEAEGRTGKALRYYAKALKVDPLNAEAYCRRGKIFEAKGRLDEAANEYQAALQADRAYAEAKTAWASLSERLNASDAKK
jgi:tetratricopeptide (TPR) repeat protein